MPYWSGQKPSPSTDHDSPFDASRAPTPSEWCSILARTSADASVLGENSVLFHGPNAPEERIKAISDTGTEVVELETILTDWI